MQSFTQSRNNATLLSKQNDRKSSIIAGNLLKGDEIYQKYAASQSKHIHKTDTVITTAVENHAKQKTVSTISDDISKRLNLRKVDGKKNSKNLNKIQYKNKHLWSKRSIEIEKLLKPLIVTDGDYFPEYDVLVGLVAGTEIGLVDSIAITKNDDLAVTQRSDNGDMLQEDNNNINNSNRDSLTRVFSPWSYFAEQFMFTKDNCSKTEVGATVLSLVNDFITQHREAQAKQEKVVHAGGVALHLNKVVASADNGNNNGNGASNNGKVAQSDGEFKCAALLKAVTAEGNVHVRPLCTSSDVVIALYELLDCEIFRSGAVQLPHILNSIFKRHTDGFYRYTYSLNKPGEWQYFRINLPTDLTDLRGFLCPALCDHDLLYESVSTTDVSLVPRDLLAASEKVTRLVRAHYGEKRLLTSMVVDFEAAYKIHGSMGSVINSNTAAGSQSQVVFGKALKGTVAVVGVTERDYRFRLLQIAKTSFTDRWAAYRRKAICGLDGMSKEYLRDFHSFFRTEWAKLEKHQKLLEEQRRQREQSRGSSRNHQNVAVVSTRRKATTSDDYHYQLVNTNGLGRRSSMSEATIQQDEDSNYCLMAATEFARHKFHELEDLVGAEGESGESSGEEDVQRFDEAESSVFAFAASKEARAAVMKRYARQVNSSAVQSQSGESAAIAEESAVTASGDGVLQRKRQQATAQFSSESRRDGSAEVREKELRSAQLIKKYRNAPDAVSEVNVEVVPPPPMKPRDLSPGSPSSNSVRFILSKQLTGAGSDGPDSPGATISVDRKLLEENKVLRKRLKSQHHINNNYSQLNEDDSFSLLMELARLEYLNNYLQSLNETKKATITGIARYRENDLAVAQLLGAKKSRSPDQPGVSPEDLRIHLTLPLEYQLDDLFMPPLEADEDSLGGADDPRGAVWQKATKSPLFNYKAAVARPSTEKTAARSVVEKVVDTAQLITQVTDHSLVALTSLPKRKSALRGHKTPRSNPKVLHIAVPHGPSSSTTQLSSTAALSQSLSPSRSQSNSNANLNTASKSQSNSNGGSNNNSNNNSSAQLPSTLTLAIQPTSSPSSRNITPSASAKSFAPAGQQSSRQLPIKATLATRAGEVNHLTVLQDENKQLAKEAYSLAQRIDTSYLFGAFDINNHIDKNNKIVLHKNILTAEDSIILPDIVSPTGREGGKSVSFSAPVDWSSRAAADISLPQPQQDTIPEKQEEPVDVIEELRAKYELESERMLQLLLDGLDPAMAAKIRKRLADQARAAALKKRMKYIMRRRQMEELTQELVEDLERYYAENRANNPRFGEMSDSSDSDEDEEERNRRSAQEVENLLGDYLDPEMVNRLILQRIQEELERQQELERLAAAEALRKLKESRRVVFQKRPPGVLLTEELDKRLSIVKQRLSINPATYFAQQAEIAAAVVNRTRHPPRMNMATLKAAMLDMEQRKGTQRHPLGEFTDSISTAAPSEKSFAARSSPCRGAAEGGGSIGALSHSDAHTKGGLLWGNFPGLYDGTMAPEPFSADLSASQQSSDSLPDQSPLSSPAPSKTRKSKIVKDHRLVLGGEVDESLDADSSVLSTQDSSYSRLDGGAAVMSDASLSEEEDTAVEYFLSEDDSEGFAGRVGDERDEREDGTYEGVSSHIARLIEELSMQRKNAPPATKKKRHKVHHQSGARKSDPLIDFDNRARSSYGKQRQRSRSDFELWDKSRPLNRPGTSAANPRTGRVTPKVKKVAELEPELSPSPEDKQAVGNHNHNGTLLMLSTPRTADSTVIGSLHKVSLEVYSSISAHRASTASSASNKKMNVYDNLLPKLVAHPAVATRDVHTTHSEGEYLIPQSHEAPLSVVSSDAMPQSHPSAPVHKPKPSMSSPSPRKMKVLSSGSYKPKFSEGRVNAGNHHSDILEQRVAVQVASSLQEQEECSVVSLNSEAEPLVFTDDLSSVHSFEPLPDMYSQQQQQQQQQQLAGECEEMNEFGETALDALWSAHITGSAKQQRYVLSRPMTDTLRDDEDQPVLFGLQLSQLSGVSSREAFDPPSFPTDTVEITAEITAEFPTESLCLQEQKELCTTDSNAMDGLDKEDNGLADNMPLQAVNNELYAEPPIVCDGIAEELLLFIREQSPDGVDEHSAAPAAALQVSSPVAMSLLTVGGAEWIPVVATNTPRFLMDVKKSPKSSDAHKREAAATLAATTADQHLLSSSAVSRPLLTDLLMEHSLLGDPTRHDTPRVLFAPRPVVPHPPAAANSPRQLFKTHQTRNLVEKAPSERQPQQQQTSGQREKGAKISTGSTVKRAKPFTGLTTTLLGSQEQSAQQSALPSNASLTGVHISANNKSAEKQQAI